MQQLCMNKFVSPTTGKSIWSFVSFIVLAKYLNGAGLCSLSSRQSLEPERFLYGSSSVSSLRMLSWFFWLEYMFGNIIGGSVPAIFLQRYKYEMSPSVVLLAGGPFFLWYCGERYRNRLPGCSTGGFGVSLCQAPISILWVWGRDFSEKS